jgi:hypothetical protein
VKWRAVIFLPILLRALIPVGFMPMAGPGLGIQLVICDGYAPAPSNTSSLSTDRPADVAMGAAMGSMPSHGGHPHHEDRGTCLYGSAPALAALPSLATLPLLVEEAMEPAVGAAQVADFKVSFRAQSPRGPPV